MNDQQELEDLKLLAMMAARLAGRNPEQRIVVSIGGNVVFDDVAWKYPDFLSRAKAAYDLLHKGVGF